MSWSSIILVLFIIYIVMIESAHERDAKKIRERLNDTRRKASGDESV